MEREWTALHFKILCQCVSEVQGEKNNFPQEVWGGLEESDVGQGDAKSRHFHYFFTMHSKCVFH